MVNGKRPGKIIIFYVDSSSDVADQLHLDLQSALIAILNSEGCSSCQHLHGVFPKIYQLKLLGSLAKKYLLPGNK